MILKIDQGPRCIVETTWLGKLNADIKQTDCSTTIFTKLILSVLYFYGFFLQLSKQSYGFLPHFSPYDKSYVILYRVCHDDQFEDRTDTFAMLYCGRKIDIQYSKIRNASIYFVCRGPCPHKFEINNSNMIELTPEKLSMSSNFPRWWVICPHPSNNWTEHCFCKIGDVDNGYINDRGGFNDTPMYCNICCQPLKCHHGWLNKLSVKSIKLCSL